MSEKAAQAKTRAVKICDTVNKEMYYLYIFSVVSESYLW